MAVKKTTPYGGYSILIDPTPANEPLRAALANSRSCSEALPVDDWDAYELGLIMIEPDHLNYAVLMARGKERQTTTRYKVTFEVIVDLDRLPLRVFSPTSRTALLTHQLGNSDGSGDRIKPSLWRAMLATIRKHRPLLTDAVQYLESRRQQALQPVVSSSSKAQSTSSSRTKAEAQDAQMTALAVSGMRSRYQLTPLQPIDSRETKLLAHDLQAGLGDWNPTWYQHSKLQRFRRGDDYLAIIEVNQGTLEESLGVDLIYYHEAVRAFVLIQYKRLQAAGDDWVYFPTTSTHAKELRTMQRRARQFKRTGRITDTPDYRFSAQPFFFKLCYPLNETSTHQQPLEGLYIPLDYWQLYLTTPAARGIRKGIRITPTIPHLDTNTFIHLLRLGWIGSQTDATALITAHIKEATANHRAIYIAEFKRIITHQTSLPLDMP